MAFEIFPDLLSLLTASQITQMASQTCCCGKHQVGKIKGEGGRGLVSVTGSAPHLAGWQACEHTCAHTLEHTDASAQEPGTKQFKIFLMVRNMSACLFYHNKGNVTQAMGKIKLQY